jgi:non-lysosomal glucosylceramidase
LEKSYFTYDGTDGAHVSFPLGGIGSGCIGLSASGRLVDWEIANHPDKWNLNGLSHFAIKAEAGGEVVDVRILNGPFKGDLSGDRGAGPVREFGFGVRREYLTGLPHFRECSFQGFFPAAQLTFADADFPGRVDLLAFNPFIPLDSERSALPTAMFEIAVTNPCDRPLRYSVIGCLGNPIKGPHRSRLARSDHMTGMVNFSDIEPTSPDFGEVMVVTDGDEVSWQHELYRGSWFDALEVYWRDLNAVGPLRDRVYDGQHIDRRYDGRGRHKGHSCLASHREVAPGARAVFRFAIAWYFPVVTRNWLNTYGYAAEPRSDMRSFRNHYTTRWKGVEEVAATITKDWTALRDETLAFRECLRSSTLPDAVLDAVSANISILKSPTVLRLEDGTFYGFEGSDAIVGSCEGSCTHVWNYQQALPFLFPDLERGMRAADFRHNIDPETGGMSFRVCVPLGEARYDINPCADGQFGNVMKAYRDWKISGDDSWLAGIWPQVKAAIEFAWHPGNMDRWDPDRTGVLWGRQHHTLDMELFGPNSWLTGFYLGALRAGCEMARRIGDEATATEYETVFARGKEWMAANLFNGSHFVQKIDIKSRKLLSMFERSRKSPVLDGSIYELYWSDEHGEIKYQVDQGCLTDQVIAQWHADLYGIGDLFDRDQVKATLDSIFRLNFKPRLGDVANPCRVFGLEEEAGVVVCDWTKGGPRPAIPVPYSQETFHGVEYAFGAMLFDAGDVRRGLAVFKAVRDRYRGHNRNPWNEMECGSNYARSMASYGGLLALSGFRFDMTAGRIAFDPKLQSAGRFRCFWALASGWGEVAIEDGWLTLRVSGGSIRLNRIGLPAAAEGGPVSMMIDDQRLEAAMDGRDVCLAPTVLTAGSTLRIHNRNLNLWNLPEVSGL